jgi:hypothetical protein
MQKFVKSGIVVASALVLGTIGTWMNRSDPSVVHADPTTTIAGPFPLPVTVTNSPSVNVANSPNVNVANSPNVNVANSPTVTVGNTATNPVLTQDAGQPFQFNQIGTSLFFSFNVPPAKTLIIENVSIACQEALATGYFTDFRLFTTLNGYGTAQNTFSPANVSGPANYYLTTNQVTHIYASGGTSILVGTGNGTPVAGTSCDTTISGRLVNP